MSPWLELEHGSSISFKPYGPPAEFFSLPLGHHAETAGRSISFHFITMANVWLFLIYEFTVIKYFSLYVLSFLFSLVISRPLLSSLMHCSKNHLKKIWVWHSVKHSLCLFKCLRNNLTVFDMKTVQGHGAKELLKVGGKLPSPGASLRFNVPQSTLMECRDGKINVSNLNFS